MHSSTRPRPTLLGYQVVGVILDAAGRLALPAAFLGLSRGAWEPALLASTVACLASAARSLVGARAVERGLSEAWLAAVNAVRGRSAESLPRGREDEQSVALLLHAISDRAIFRAVTVPQTGGLALAFVGILVASFLVVGAFTSLAGGALLLALSGLGIALGRGLRQSQDRAWKAFGALSLDMRVLLEGALELRAAGREGAVAGRVLASARSVAHHQARATSAGLRMGLLPASLALVAIAAPLRAGVHRVQNALAGERLFEASIIGASALAVAVAAGRTWGLWATSAPLRERYDGLVKKSGPLRAMPSRKLPRALSEATIVFEGFGHDWSGNGVMTPKALDLELRPSSGTALCGANGAGKTTALLALLGAIRPSRGEVTIDGVSTYDMDGASFAGEIGYVPQDPFLLSGETLAWHCRLYEDVSDAAIDTALRAAGLHQVLEARSRSRGIPVRELPAGELSGGERRKLALARALQTRRSLYVLDEPEAGLDAVARGALRDLLAELATRSRVLVVAHDETIVPRSFVIVAMAR